MTVRKVLTILTISCLVLALGSDRTENLHLAQASDAAVNFNGPATLTDNYGNPDRFVKYIIRKPPVVA